MTTCEPKPVARKTEQQPVPAREHLPEPPDRRLWEPDSTRAFEDGVRWFLAVSRAA